MEKLEYQITAYGDRESVDAFTFALTSLLKSPPDGIIVDETVTRYRITGTEATIES